MNMQGPGGVWPNGRNANDDDDDDTMPLDPPLHHWGYQGFARATRSTAAPFASPIVSQNQRESFARLQTAQALLSPRRRLDPLHAPAVDWNTAESYDDHDPLDFEQEDTKMSDPFPLEGPLDIYHDEYHQELDHDAHIPPAPSLETARYEMVDPPAAAAARSPPVAGPVRVCLHAGNKKSSSSRSSSRNRRSSRMPHKQPSKTEIASCSTKRAAEALRVWYKRFNELVDYRELTGDCNVPQKYSPNPALGIW